MTCSRVNLCDFCVHFTQNHKEHYPPSAMKISYISSLLPSLLKLLGNNDFPQIMVCCGSVPSVLLSLKEKYVNKHHQKASLGGTENLIQGIQTLGCL